MKKVVFSIKKVRNPDEKLSGFGFINDEGTLLCKCVSKTGKRYTRAFDEVEQHCHPIIGKENEFKGYVQSSISRFVLHLEQAKLFCPPNLPSNPKNFRISCVLVPYLASETFYIRIIAYFNLKINNFWRTFPHKYKMFSLAYPQISNISLFFD